MNTQMKEGKVTDDKAERRKESKKKKKKIEMAEKKIKDKWK